MNVRSAWVPLAAGPVFAVLAMVLAVPRLAGASTARSSASVQALYQQDCATCHGARGQGTSRGTRIAGAGTALVDYMLSTGRMPLTQPTDKLERHPPAYDDATRAALVRYIADFAPGGPPIPDVDLAHADLGRGLQLFQLNCAPCHSAAGSGGALLDTSAPDLHESAPTQVAEAVRSGPSPMPVFGAAALNAQQLNDVVAYVQQLRHPDDRGGIALDRLGPLPEGAVALVIGLGGLIVVTILIERRRRA